MTMCALNARLLSLTMYKSDLEYKILSITNRRQIIAYQTAALADLDFESDEMSQLQAIDQIYELEQTNLETQQKAVTAEFDSVQKLLDNNIKKDFKINVS
ncbi:hypothetical protein J6Q66_01410 [bacterium]|nr:hypothetical protein [bacterium]